MKTRLEGYALDRITLAAALPAQIAATLPPAVKTREGYWRVWGYAARSGNVQDYPSLPAGLQRQHRPPEEVFSAESLASYRGVPVLVQHPSGRGAAYQLLDPATVSAHAQGSVVEAEQALSVAGVDGLDLVRVELLITGAEGVREVESPTGLRELSAGYWRRLDPTPGASPSGEAYDCVQREIQINHVALEPAGRAGPEVRLRGATDSSPQGRQEKKMELIEVTLPDGRIVRIAKEDAGVVKGFVAAADAAAQAQAQTATDAAEAATLRADLERLQVATDAAQVEGLRKELAPLLPGVSLDGLDAKGLRRAATKVAYPELVEGFSDAAVDGIFPKVLAKLADAKGKVEQALGGTGGEQSTDASSDKKRYDELRRKNLEDQANAWRKQPAQA